MLPAHAKALLRIGHAAVLGRLGAQDDVFELVHARVGKHQRGVVFYYHRCRGYDMVRLAFKEVFE